MRFVSTCGISPAVGFREALFAQLREHHLNVTRLDLIEAHLADRRLDVEPDDPLVAVACDVGDVGAMSERALQILSEDKLRKRMGEAGRAWAIDQYQIARVIPQYQAYYEKVLSG